jgi:hypothetical protein
MSVPDVLLTTLYLPCEEAIDPGGEPAKAVCRCVDGSWIAWWGAPPWEGWARATDLRYPSGGGFDPPHPSKSRVTVNGRRYRVGQVDCRRLDNLPELERLVADPEEERQDSDWVWVLHLEALEV